MNVGSFETDIKPNSSSSVDGRAEKPLWTRSDNTFRFNFFAGDSPALQEQSCSSDRTEAAVNQTSFTGQSSAFAFNFQIPPVIPEEDMTTEASDVAHCVQEENPVVLEGVNSPPEPLKTKKKKKSGKKKASDSTEAKQEPSSAEGSQGGEDAELVSVKCFPFKVIMVDSV